MLSYIASSAALLETSRYVTSTARSAPLAVATRLGCGCQAEYLTAQYKMAVILALQSPRAAFLPRPPQYAQPGRHLSKVLRPARWAPGRLVKLGRMSTATRELEVSPPTRPRRLNVGVVGIGRIGQRHALNVLHVLPRTNLLCVCSPAQPDLDWAEIHVRPYGVQVFKTAEEMLETPGLEAVIIASATFLHVKHSLQALDKRIHVLCEKPIATSLNELAYVIQRADLNPTTKLMVGYSRRFDENYREALQKVQAGLIGAPIIFRSHGCEKFDPSPFMKMYLKTSGGIFVDSAIHDIDLAISFFGEDAKPKALWATGIASLHRELEESKDADNAVGVVEFWGGKIACFYHSRTATHGYDNTSEIIGNAGKILINPVPRKNRIEVADHSGIRTDATPSWIDRYEQAFITEVRDFADAILDDKDLPLKLSSALTGLQIANALQQSLATGRKFEFDRDGNQITSLKL